jgi:predicted acyltransferase
MSTTATDAAQSTSSRRLGSLDAFRGLAILGMLLVNEKTFGAATPEQLTHAGWSEGIHLADFVFPWFLFIVGVAIPFSAAARRQRGMTRKAYYLGALRRTAILVLLGCLINSSYAHRPLFDIGILQLIGFAYFVAALLSAASIRVRLGVATAFLVGYWALLRFLPIPGASAGVFEKQLNAITYLNDTYLSRLSLGNATSVIPTAALVLIGTAIGDIVRSTQPSRRKMQVMLISGVSMTLVGWLGGFSIQPNKPLWTPSFILISAGCGILVLGVFYYLIDVRQLRRWAFPLVVAGMNAIVAFVGPMLVNLHILREWQITTHAGHTMALEDVLKDSFFTTFGRVPGGTLYTFLYILLWWLVLLWLYRRRIFLRV